jgi:hypothetical protein
VHLHHLIDEFSSNSVTNLNNSTDSSSPVDINDDLTINYRSNTNEISFRENTNGKTEENNEIHDSLPKTIREEKLLAVSRLFNICYRTVIPNRPPAVSSRTMTFNPPPIGKNFSIYSLKSRLFLLRTGNRTFN